MFLGNIFNSKKALKKRKNYRFYKDYILKRDIKGTIAL